MSFLVPVLSAVFQAASLTIDKVVLSIKGITYQVYVGISFPLLVVIDLAAYAIFRPVTNPALFLPSNFLLLIITAIFAILSNFTFYRALHDDKLVEMELWGLVGIFPTILLVSMVFPGERQPIILAGAVIASAVAIWSHWKKGGFRVEKKTWPYVLWVMALAPVNMLVSKQLLMVASPIVTELVRDLAVAVAFGPILFRNHGHVSRRAMALLLATNVLTGASYILYGRSIQISGVIFTMLVILLLPLLTYFSSLLILKERFDRRKTIAFFAILAILVAVKLIR